MRTIKPFLKKIVSSVGYGEKKSIKWQVLLISHNFHCGPLYFWSYFTDMYTIRSDEIYQ